VPIEYIVDIYHRTRHRHPRSPGRDDDTRSEAGAKAGSAGPTETVATAQSPRRGPGGGPALPPLVPRQTTIGSGLRQVGHFLRIAALSRCKGLRSRIGRIQSGRTKERPAPVRSRNGTTASCDDCTLSLRSLVGRIGGSSRPPLLERERIYREQRSGLLAATEDSCGERCLTRH
jgi:hypothetical protein